MKDVAEWLRKYLREHGETNCEVVKDAAKKAGYTCGEIRDAKLICCIRSQSTISWALPDDEIPKRLGI